MSIGLGLEVSLVAVQLLWQLFVYLYYSMFVVAEWPEEEAGQLLQQLMVQTQVCQVTAIKVRNRVSLSQKPLAMKVSKKHTLCTTVKSVEMTQSAFQGHFGEILNQSKIIYPFSLWT